MVKVTNKALKKLYSEKQAFINGSLSKFDKGLRKLQENLFDLIITEYLPQFTVKDGVILLNEKNARLLNELDNLLLTFKETQADSLFSTLGRDMLKNTEYLSNYFRAFNSKKTVLNISNKLDKLSSFIGIDSKGQLIEGSYLNNLALTPELKANLSQYFRNAIESKSDYKSFLKLIKDTVKGNAEADGVLQRYVETKAHDAFFAQSQMQENFFAQELELTYFVYEGTEIKTTREFCSERVNNVYSREDAEEWNTMDWAGKIPDVDFFIQRGGYNCRHFIRWIPEDVAAEIQPEIFNQEQEQESE